MGIKGGKICIIFSMYQKRELKPAKKQLMELIHKVQDEVQDSFTFQYKFVGSVQRNMVTCDVKSNAGFDFDVNIMVNDDDKDFEAEEIKNILMCAFNKYARKYGYDSCEDSTRVFTIKVKDRKNSRIRHSCDFAIVNDYGNNQQEYIRYNKKRKNYTWEEQTKGFYCLPEKIEFCKDNQLWQEVREIYLDKKNYNMDSNKKSRSIFAETIHEVCHRNGFYD